MGDGLWQSLHPGRWRPTEAFRGGRHAVGDAGSAGASSARSWWSSRLVFLAPIAYSIYLSLFRDQLIGGNSFVGLDNYTQAFQDPEFWAASAGSALFLVVQVPIMLGIALLVALALDSGRLYGGTSSGSRSSCPTRSRRSSPPSCGASCTASSSAWSATSTTHFGISLPDPLVPAPGAGRHRQHRHLGVRRLQHADLLLRATRRSRSRSTRPPRSTAPGSGASSGAIKLPAIRGAVVIATDLLDHRQLPAVQRAEHPQAAGAATRSPPTSPRTCTPTRCPSPASSTTTPRPSRSSWASSR